MEEKILELPEEDSETAAAFLAHEYGTLVRYIVKGIVQNEDLAERCVVEIFNNITSKAIPYETRKDKFYLWLISYTRNTAYFYSREVREEDKIKSENNKEIVQEAEDALLLRQKRQNDLYHLMKCLEKFTVQEQGLFFRKYYYMQSNTQIALELGKTEDAVEKKIRRLRKKFLALVGGEFGEYTTGKEA